jgi:hypothetical protein
MTVQKIYHGKLGPMAMGYQMNLNRFTTPSKCCHHYHYHRRYLRFCADFFCIFRLLTQIACMSFMLYRRSLVYL